MTAESQSLVTRAEVLENPDVRSALGDGPELTDSEAEALAILLNPRNDPSTVREGAPRDHRLTTTGPQIRLTDVHGMGPTPSPVHPA